MIKAPIRILAFAAIFAMLCALCLPAAALDQEPDGTPVEIPWEDGIAPGDVNGDGAINKKDSLALKKYLADPSYVIDMEARSEEHTSELQSRE